MVQNVSPKKILIVKTSSLGDVLHTFSAVHAIKKMFPQAEIDWLVMPAFIPLVSLHPDVHHTLPYHRDGLRSPFTFFPTLFSMLRLIRRPKYDWVIDFQGLIRSAVFVGFSKGKRKIGFNNPREPLARLFYSEKIQVPNKKIHAVARNNQLAALATGCDAATEWPILKKDPTAMQKVAELLKKHRSECKLIGIVPGARWESKMWPADFFIKFMKSLLEQAPKTQFVIIGGPNENHIADTLTAAVGEANVISTVGKTTSNELIEVIRACDSVLSSDTGPLHIAVALNVPTYSIFGPNNPEYSGPIGERHHIYTVNTPCAPCMKRKCPHPNGDKIPCHDTIAINQIVSDIIRQPLYPKDSL